MERISLPKKVVEAILYIGGIIPAIFIWIFDKEFDKTVKVHIYQSLILSAFGIVIPCLAWASAIVSIVFGIIALVKGEAPSLPWLRAKVKEAADK